MSAAFLPATQSPNKFLHSCFATTERDYPLATKYALCKELSLNGNAFTSRWIPTLKMVDSLIFLLLAAFHNTVLCAVRAPVTLLSGEVDRARHDAWYTFKLTGGCIKQIVPILFAGALGLFAPNLVYPAIANAVLMRDEEES